MRMLGLRQLLLATLSIVLLVAAVGRLWSLNRAELRLVAAARNRHSLVPASGSLYGIGSAGPVAASDLGRPAYLLIFVVRSSHIKSDRDYWNEVAHGIAPAAMPLRCWGVCDAGHACDSSLEGAQFVVVGFLDPYQMHIVATAEADGAALLYGPQGALLGLVKRDRDPSVTARFVNELIH
jgi:hypothetical protein